MAASDEIGTRVDRRLAELYERHRQAELPADARCYVSGQGYSAVKTSAARPDDAFAITLAGLDGSLASVGDDDVAFALQSVSKVFAYGLALEDHGRERVLERVGVEPSGDAYNSIEFDERHNRPYNPMVNAGALVTSDLVRGADPAEQIERLRGSFCEYAGQNDLQVDERVLELELADADRNRATAYLMRAHGMIAGDVEDTLHVYLSQCSIKVTCRQLAIMAATLANGGVNPVTGRICLPRARVRDVLSVMYTCGMYGLRGRVGLRGRGSRQERGERCDPLRDPRQARHRGVLARSRRVRQQHPRRPGVPGDLRAAGPARLRDRGRG